MKFYIFHLTKIKDAFQLVLNKVSECITQDRTEINLVEVRLVIIDNHMDIDF